MYEDIYIWINLIGDLFFIFLIFFNLFILDVWIFNFDDSFIVCGNNFGVVWVDVVNSYVICEKEKVEGI